MYVPHLCRVQLAQLRLMHSDDDAGRPAGRRLLLLLHTTPGERARPACHVAAGSLDCGGRTRLRDWRVYSRGPGAGLAAVPITRCSLRASAWGPCTAGGHRFDAANLGSLLASRESSGTAGIRRPARTSVSAVKSSY
jgi:hypothetical protein